MRSMMSDVRIAGTSIWIAIGSAFILISDIYARDAGSISEMLKLGLETPLPRSKELGAVELQIRCHQRKCWISDRQISQVAFRFGDRTLRSYGRPIVLRKQAYMCTPSKSRMRKCLTKTRHMVKLWSMGSS